MLLIMDGVIEQKGKVQKTDFAERLYEWAKYGISKLGDKSMLHYWCILGLLCIFQVA